MKDIKVKIYKLIDPNTLEVRYIGRTVQTLNKRLNGHLSKARKKRSNTYIQNWLLSLIQNKQKPLIEFITEIIGWSESYKFEQALISEFIRNGYNLVNLHDRGEGGIMRIITDEQKRKISSSVKLLHDQGKLSSGRKPLDVYDLEGNFIQSFPSIISCAKWMSISNKQLEISLRRKAKRVHNYQILFKGSSNPGKYSNKRNKTNARLNQGELLENQETDNQQPSLSSNTFEGSTTNSRVLNEDGNADKIALQSVVVERDSNGNPLMSMTFIMLDLSKKKIDDIV